MDESQAMFDEIESFGQLWIGGDGRLRGLVRSDNCYPQPEIDPAGWTAALVAKRCAPIAPNNGFSV